MDGCNWWDVVCGWNGLSTDQKGLVVTVVVVAVVAASCLVGCEGLLAAPSMLAAGGLDIGMSSLAVGAIGLGTEFTGIGYASYGITRAGFSLYDSLSGGSASTRVTPNKTTVGDTGGSGFNVVTPVNPGPNMEGSSNPWPTTGSGALSGGVGRTGGSSPGFIGRSER